MAQVKPLKTDDIMRKYNSRICEQYLKVAVIFFLGC